MHSLISLFADQLNLAAQTAPQVTSTPWYITTVAFLGMLVILVFFHELGHFVTAILLGIQVEEFGIGYPPRAKVLFEHKGVKYTLNWLPLGGFVRFKGEDDSVYGVGSLAAAKPWRKIPVMAAGPLMNLVLAFVTFALIFSLSGIPQLKQAIMQDIFAGTPAAKAGLRSGDLLIKINGKPLSQSESFKRVAEQNKGKSIPVVIIREKTELTLQITPSVWATPDGKQHSVGFGFGYLPDYELVPASPPVALVASLAHTSELLLRMIKGITDLVGGLFQLNPPPQGGVAGPIGIARATGEVLQTSGMVGFWNWMAILSLNLFLLNLLPIPALDGSHILFALVEWARGGKKVPPEKEAIVHAIGFATLMGLMILVSVSDLLNALNGTSVLKGG